jgi:ABC-2 type transport system permease protein
MNQVLLIAKNDLRLFLKEKAAYFWLFGAPLLFAFFMGMSRGRDDPSDPNPRLLLENRDAGFMGKIFVEQLGEQGFSLLSPKNSDAIRGVRIPVNFTESVLAKKAVKMEFFEKGSSQADASMLTEARLVRALVALNGYLIEHGTKTNLTEASLRAVIAKPNTVSVTSSWGSRKPIPKGYNQSIPGVLVMFVMMNLLIFGGTSVASERREGVLRRFAVHPVTRMQLVYGKIAGLLGLGLVQITYMLVAAALLMHFRLGSQFPLVLLVLVIYGWAAGSLGVLIGSVVQRDDKIVAICVLATMVMAALGGCWWPLEIVPKNIQFVAFTTPVAWAMHALHQLISFGGGFREILPALAVLALFAAGANALAARFFRV